MADRRIERTREMVFTALTGLLSEKSIMKITVTELCDIANINKSIFYLHFRSIDDCHEQWKELVFSIIKERANGLTYYNLYKKKDVLVRILTDFFANNYDLLVKAKESDFGGEIQFLFIDSLSKCISDNSGFDSEINAKEIFILNYIISGAVYACFNRIPVFDKEKATALLSNLFDFLNFLKREHEGKYDGNN
ncbi:MAG TPA: TetR/AcrR family transcriptional regulator [Clostridiales bacterium]|nr:TetR/AcrR family transcriptional regulator [Clostridiales bacterium]